jgi:hypothetical protein
MPELTAQPERRVQDATTNSEHITRDAAEGNLECFKTLPPQRAADDSSDWTGIEGHAEAG